MTKLIVLVAATLIFLPTAQARTANGFLASCGQFSSALYANALAILTAASSAVSGPKCEEVQLSKTCTATYYGKGDGFASGTTACGDNFKPLKENTVAIKTAAGGGFFSKSLCGKKALVTTKDPSTGKSKTVEVRITDSGSMGGKTSKRCMDLSYRAANELGIIKRGVASNTTIKVCK